MLSFPLVVTAAGNLAAVPVDSAADVAQSVALLLDTRPGERRSVPDYGLPDPVFTDVTTQDVAVVISEWEPRADPAQVEEAADQLITQHIRVHPREES